MNETVYPISTLQAGLFPVGTTPVTLSDLLKNKIPPRAQTVVLRAVGTNSGTVYVERLDGNGPDHELRPEVNIEMTVADLATHSVRADGEHGDSIVASYTRRMSDREAG